MVDTNYFTNPQELPRDRPELYNQASRVLLHQWDVERNLIEQKLDPVTIDYRDKQAMLRKVAYHMQSGEAGLAGNIISAQDLESILTDYLKSIDVDQPRDVARRMIRQLRERNFILCYLGADYYAFVHRTFLEFFAAWAFVWEFKETQTISFEELRDQTIRVRWQDESWQEVLRLIAGMLDSRFVGELIRFLINQDIPEETRLTKLTSIIDRYTAHTCGEVFLERLDIEHLLLASDFIDELKAPSEILGKTFILREKLKTIIENKPISSDEIYSCELEPFGFAECEFYLDKLSAVKLIKAVFKVWTENNELLDLLKKWSISSLGKDLKEVSIMAISQNFTMFKDLIPWLKARAQEDEHDNVRIAVVRGVVQGWKDDSDTLSWLKSCAQEHQHADVRMAAVQELAEGFKDDPDTLSILRICAQEDDHPIVRIAAVQELPKVFRDGPDTLSILRTRAQEDDHHAVRGAALQGLEEYKDNKGVFEFLLNCALNDPFTFNKFLNVNLKENPRQTALNVLVQQYPDHPKTLELLRDRAQNDNDEQLKEWATIQLEKLKMQN